MKPIVDIAELQGIPRANTDGDELAKQLDQIEQSPEPIASKDDKRSHTETSQEQGRRLTAILNTKKNQRGDDPLNILPPKEKQR